MTVRADQVSDKMSAGSADIAPDSADTANHEHEQETLKRDMLLGHLLTMAFQVLAVQLHICTHFADPAGGRSTCCSEASISHEIVMMLHLSAAL